MEKCLAALFSHLKVRYAKRNVSPVLGTHSALWSVISFFLHIKGKFENFLIGKCRVFLFLILQPECIIPPTAPVCIINTFSFETRTFW